MHRRQVIAALAGFGAAGLAQGSEIGRLILARMNAVRVP